MRLVQLAICVGCGILGSTAIVHAQEPHSSSAWHAFWQRVELDWHRNNAYPEPFRYTDRQLVRTQWTPYVAKGWQIQNTLSDWHFDADSQSLTRAGRAKVRWIVTQTPVQRRTIFVLRGPNEEATESRVALVHKAVSQLRPSGPVPDVVRTDVAPPQMTGDYLNEIWKKAEASIPPPVLPTATSEGSGD